MKKLLLFLFLGGVLQLSAQDADSTRFYKNSFTNANRKLIIGAHAGTTSGVGFSAEVGNHQNAVQLVFMPIGSQDYQFISSGLTFFTKIRDLKGTSLEAYVSGAYTYTWNDYYVYDYYEPYTTAEEKHKLDLGTGLSLSLKQNNIFHFRVMTGFGFYNLTDPSSRLYSLAGGVGIGLFL